MPRPSQEEHPDHQASFSVSWQLALKLVSLAPSSKVDILAVPWPRYCPGPLGECVLGRPMFSTAGAQGTATLV